MRTKKITKTKNKTKSHSFNDKSSSHSGKEYTIIISPYCSTSSHVWKEKKTNCGGSTFNYFYFSLSPCQSHFDGHESFTMEKGIAAHTEKPASQLNYLQSGKHLQQHVRAEPLATTSLKLGFFHGVDRGKGPTVGGRLWVVFMSSVLWL